MRRLLLKRKRAVTPQSALMKDIDSNAIGVNVNMADGFNVQTAQTDYDSQKLRLLSKETETNWDYQARITATKEEQRAQHILWTIREDERIGLFGNVASERIPDPITTRDMGGQFLTNKAWINRSRVYRMAQRMPKGMHLHLHFNAELAPDELIERAITLECMFVRSTRPLVREEDYAESEIVFSVLPLSTTTVDIFSSNYNGEFRAAGSTPWMRWSTFREEFQKRRGEPVENWIRGKLILTEAEVYGIEQTTNG
jgi:adenosine deaminase CECR1